MYLLEIFVIHYTCFTTFIFSSQESDSPKQIYILLIQSIYSFVQNVCGIVLTAQLGIILNKNILIRLNSLRSD